MRTKKRDTYGLGHKVLTVVEVLFIVLMQVVVPFQFIQPAAASAAAPAAGIQPVLRRKSQRGFYEYSTEI